MRNELYNELWDLYQGKKESPDSINKGERIAEIIYSLLDDIAYPLPVSKEQRIGNLIFDGEINLGTGHKAFFDIHIGSFSIFRYFNSFETGLNNLFSNKNHLIYIAHDFPKTENKYLNEIIKQDSAKPTITFIDYSTLISLHKFNEERIMSARQHKGHMRQLKKLFLQNLFNSARPQLSVISFNESIVHAEDSITEKIKSESKYSDVSQERQNVYIIEEQDFEERLRRVEELADLLFKEIRALREVSAKRQIS